MRPWCRLMPSLCNFHVIVIRICLFSATADLVVIVTNSVGGSANGGTTGNYVKLQITVGTLLGSGLNLLAAALRVAR